jgi:ABC-2 type transport system ATP-binding protein
VPGLTVTDLRRTFADVVALDGLGFHVPPGQVCGFVGRNGAGKTTTMRIVCDLLAADAGTVTWQGGRVDPERIGYMPEERGLYPKMRVGDQLEYLGVLHGNTHAEARAIARTWLGRLGLGERERARAEELSQGNQQRVQLAMALVHRPDLLVLDEPFAGLDPIVTDLLGEVLREEAERGAAVLLSSHQLELVEHLCESVIIINRGRLVAEGRVDELRAAGPRHVRIDVGDAPGDWTDSLSGVTRIAHDDGRVVLALDATTDPQRILDAARAAGTVTHFSEVRPALAELFRELVSA